MIAASDLRKIARARARDAKVLLGSRRFDGAFYLCGYSVEMALKARICKTLKWPGFPETSHDFKGLQSVRTHDLDILLRFSGIESRIEQNYAWDWSVVIAWNPEKRYQSVGQSSEQQATDMLICTKRLLAVI